MNEETRDVAKQESGSLATLDFVSDSGMGLENVDKQDLALPFLKLLQSGSDETKKKHAKYVEALKLVCSTIQLQRNCIMEKKE